MLYYQNFFYGYDDDGICILVEKRLNGKPLSTERNSLKINGITGKDYLNIIDNIAKIKDYDISFKLDKSYDRIEKINKYLTAISDYLDSNIINKIKSQLNKIKTLEFDMVISHGDLIPPNIFKDKDQIKFIDWEYVGMKSKYYDIIYFLLFADNLKMS